MYSACREEDCV